MKRLKKALRIQLVDRTLELTKGIIARLKAVTAVTAIVGQKIYTRPPDNTKPPYIAMTLSSTPVNDKLECQNLYRVVINCYSAEASPNQVLTLKKEIYSALNRQENNINVDNSKLVYFEIDTLNDAFIEPDGVSWQGVISFRALVD